MNLNPLQGKVVSDSTSSLAYGFISFYMCQCLSLLHSPPIIPATYLKKKKLPAYLKRGYAVVVVVVVHCCYLAADETN